jgi:hypothetical protein
MFDGIEALAPDQSAFPAGALAQIGSCAHASGYTEPAAAETALVSTVPSALVNAPGTDRRTRGIDRE